MEKEFINLENCPKIGVCNSISEGLKAFFDNLLLVLKLSKPVLWITLITWFILGISNLSRHIGYKAFPFLIFFIIAGIIVLVIWFWQYIKGLVAVSYLAKDILENKPVQAASKYYEYVHAHSASYIKYWLWMFLFSLIYSIFCTVFSIMSFFGVALSPFFVSRGNGILGILMLPFINTLTYLSVLFWAYRDKSKPLNSIIESIKYAYYPKNIITLLFVCFAQMFAVVVFCLFMFLICTLFLLIAKHSPMAMAFSLVIGAALFISYATNFVLTRYYFELTSKN